MDFPKPGKKNEPRKHEEVSIKPPELKKDDDRPVEERVLDQQWRDAERAGLGKEHPLSLNRDSDHVS